MSIRRFVIPAGCFFMGVLLTAWNARFTTVASADQNQPAADAKSASALLEAAKRVYQGHTDAMKAGVAVGKGGNAEFLYQWSRRWMDSERAIDKAKNKQIAACEGHLRRMKALEASYRSQVENGVASTYELAAAEFFRIEAEQWLAEAKGR